MRIAMLGLKGIPATYGGVERHVEELGARLAARGHAVTVYARRHYTPSTTTWRGMTVRVLPSVATKHLDTATHTALATADAMARGFDLLHFHAIGPALLSIPPRLFSRAGIVATVHGLDWRRRKWGRVARWCLRRGEWAAGTVPHRTIVVSRALQEHFAARGRRTAHIPNGVGAPQPGDMKALEPFGVREPGFLLWMGRFVPEKRVEDLVTAFRALPETRQLVLAGELNETDPYTRRVRRTAEGDARIIFPGGLYGEAKAAALRHAALVALPSELEGFPIILLEAMRYGRAVVASDLPEHHEAIRPGINGFLYPVGDAAALRERLAHLLSHPAEADAAARHAEHDARAYDWDVVTERTEEVYREVRGG